MLMLTAFTSMATIAGAQSTSIPELVFKNHTLETGVAGQNNAVYRFENVANNIDARVKIIGRSSSHVTIKSIDLDNTGHSNAFQPQVSYNNGNAPRNTNWWADFEISFVQKGASTAVPVSSFNVTAIDVDGDGGNLNEYVSFFNASSYTLENNSQLTVKSLLQLLLGLLTPGNEFVGPRTNYADIDVTATRVMTTMRYQNRSSFVVRAGGSTNNGGGSSVADRMYSFWFKSFDYNTPVNITLPIKLKSFTATLNDGKADLKWVTSSEKDVSHFVVEKSTDGKNYADAGIVFAYGNSSSDMQYHFTDDRIEASRKSIVYYRLRSVDIDGKFELSDIRLIRTGQEGNQQLSILTYPNPVTSELRITVPNSWQGKKVNYELLGNNGRTAIRKQVGSSGQTENINVSTLTPGFYIVRATCEGESVQQKIIKQ